MLPLRLLSHWRGLTDASGAWALGARTGALPGRCPRPRSAPAPHRLLGLEASWHRHLPEGQPPAEASLPSSPWVRQPSPRRLVSLLTARWDPVPWLGAATSMGQGLQPHVGPRCGLTSACPSAGASAEQPSLLGCGAAAEPPTQCHRFGHCWAAQGMAHPGFGQPGADIGKRWPHLKAACLLPVQ